MDCFCEILAQNYAPGVAASGPAAPGTWIIWSNIFYMLQEHVLKFVMYAMCIQRGIGLYFDIFFLANFHILCKMRKLIYEHKKKKSKILLKMKKPIFVKHGDEANLYSIKMSQFT